MDVEVGLAVEDVVDERAEVELCDASSENANCKLEICLKSKRKHCKRDIKQKPTSSNTTDEGIPSR